MTEHAKIRIVVDSSADMICECFPEAQIEIGESRGLVTFYAEMGGLLVGFEKRAPSL